ncbi:inner centromere protein A-like isoform X3 [Argopecten irradians]|uniref:inner centromere protein A-like isoform X3 n=1 Tax=Argopecten irradians TaxID=31199 RepID=UPI00371F6391
MIRRSSVPSSFRLGSHGSSAYKYRPTEIYRSKSQREESLRKFTNMQNAANHQSPVTPETPLPDYDEESPWTQISDNQLRFAQQFGNVLSSIADIDDQYGDVPEPEPDYDDDVIDGPVKTDDSSSLSELQNRLEPVIIRERPSSISDRPPSEGDESALIQPKRLVNPCMESKARMNLHKELLMNYKTGKDVLQKPELNKVLEERKERQKKQEWAQRESKKRTSLELKLEEQARKVSESESSNLKAIVENESDTNSSELSKVHAKILHKNGSVK